MKLTLHFMTAAGLSLATTALADSYSILAAQGYRWVNVNGPYACRTEQDVQRIVAHHNDATELEVIQNIGCYYLTPGSIVQIITEDSARGMSEFRLGSIATPLWTYTRFLSRHPVQDTYGFIEKPENSGLVPSADITNGRKRPDRISQNENP